MIINETKNTYEDIKYMFKRANKSPLIIGIRLLLVIAGLYLIVKSFDLIQKNMEYFVYVSSGAQMDTSGVLLVAMIALMILLGIGLFIFSYFYARILIYRNYKVNYSKWSPRHMEFSDEGVEISFEEGGVKSATQIMYSAFVSFTRCNEAVYIEVKMPGSKASKYVCLHDDGYISGDVEELINLLENKINN